MFLTYNDTLMTVNTPNIYIDGNFYAMVHWQDNPESTDALTIDMSQEVADTASIMYLGESPILFSDYTGSSNASFFVRVNILENGPGKGTKEVLSCNIYKGLADDIANADEWTQVNPGPVTDLSYVDDNWTGGNGLVYAYAVEAIYVEGGAEYSFSNFIQLTTGLTENNTGNQNVAIYPNPATSYVNIPGIEAGKEIRAYNLTGEVVMVKDAVIPSTRIDVSNLDNGVYFIKIDSLQGEIVKKLVIKN
ncbi:MAG: T9SS type A sorting domain-containing protein [Chlorobi bacterium]|nr:T9SS type A sorting domain-containing protein [Chlorobiota bacterium]